MDKKFIKKKTIILNNKQKERIIMKNSIKKICIIGGSGTGKTTQADNLGKQLKTTSNTH